MLIIPRFLGIAAPLALTLAGLSLGACGDGPADTSIIEPGTTADAGLGGGSAPTTGGTAGAGPGTGGTVGGAGTGGTGAPSGGGGTTAGATPGGTGGNDAGAGQDMSPLMGSLPSGMAYGDWTWVEVPGAVCRDGSPSGYYYRRGKEAPLVIFMNGGGACSDPFFCSLNPANVNQDMPTESLLDATGNLLLGPDANRQVPPDEGIFKRDTRNPVADWNMIYMPYCTGDVFAGARPDATIEGVEGKQQFVGYKNVGLFLDSFGPSFANAGKVLLTGSSAGGFAVLLNFDRVQTFFDKYKAVVYGVSDSGVTFRDEYLPPCLQKKWRALWNLDAVLPKDCTGCFREDGGGLTQGLGTYLFHEKYKGRKENGIISTVEDGVIRAFFGAGLENCTIDPGFNTILSALELGGFTGEQYRKGLQDVVDFVGEDKLATYFIEGSLHMHLWRARYYEAVGGVTIAAWLGDLLAGRVTHVGATQGP